MNDSGNLLNWFLNPSNLTTIVSGILKAPINAPTQVPKGGGKEAFAHKEQALVDSSKVARFLNEQKDTVVKDRDDINALKSNIEDSIYQWSKFFRLKSKINISCNDLSNIDSAKITQIEKSFIRFKDSIRKRIDTVQIHQEYYLEICSSTTYAKFIKETGDSIINRYIQKFYITALDYLNQMDSVVSYKNLQNLTDALSSMSNYKTCFSSFPIFLTRDIKPISIQIKPWDDSTNLQSYATSFEVPWTQKQIWGVSAGIYGSGLYNDNYTPKQGTLPDTTFTLVKDKRSKAEFGIDALAYSAWKWDINYKHLFYTGIAFGAGMSIASTVKPRIMLGWLNAYGNNNRLIMILGINGGPVQRVSNAYAINSKYSTLPSGYMTDLFKVGGFISFNYSFLSK